MFVSCFLRFLVDFKLFSGFCMTGARAHVKAPRLARRDVFRGKEKRFVCVLFAVQAPFRC